MFRPKGLHQSQILHADAKAFIRARVFMQMENLHAKSGSDGSLWAETPDMHLYKLPTSLQITLKIIIVGT